MSERKIMKTKRLGECFDPQYYIIYGTFKDRLIEYHIFSSSNDAYSLQITYHYL